MRRSFLKRLIGVSLLGTFYFVGVIFSLAAQAGDLVATGDSTGDCVVLVETLAPDDGLLTKERPLTGRVGDLTACVQAADQVVARRRLDVGSGGLLKVDYVFRLKSSAFRHTGSSGYVPGGPVMGD